MALPLPTRLSLTLQKGERGPLSLPRGWATPVSPYPVSMFLALPRAQVVICYKYQRLLAEGRGNHSSFCLPDCV